MYRILVAVDGSAEANRGAQFAVDLAKRLGDSEVVLMNVQDPVDESQTHGMARHAIETHREQLALSAAATAKEMAARANVRCRFEWCFGDPAHKIVDQAKALQCDLLVMGTHGHGRLERPLLGSVAFKALHLSTVPVTLVK